MALGPYVLQAVGDVVSVKLRIAAVLWSGVTSDGDMAEIRDSVTNGLLWRGRTNSAQTHIFDGPFGIYGIPVQNGIRCSMLDGTGSVLIIYTHEG